MADANEDAIFKKQTKGLFGMYQRFGVGFRVLLDCVMTHPGLQGDQQDTLCELIAVIRRRALPEMRTANAYAVWHK